MTKILVYYRPQKDTPVCKIIIDIPDYVELYSDTCNDYCHDVISEKIGHHPIWLRTEGVEGALSPSVKIYKH